MTSVGTRSLPRVALDLLSDIERAESELLSWGIVDSSFTDAELIEIAHKRMRHALGEVMEMPYAGANEILQALREHRLLFELPEGGRFRSRTAEAIRLFFRLKQLLPRNGGEGRWRNAPNLVADYRLILRPRQYPVRHISIENVEKRFAAIGYKDHLSREVIRALLRTGSDEYLETADFQVEAAERILQELGAGPNRSGTIICAGTGSGKTLAFYLPTLLHLAKLASPEHWTRCLAIYPRNELLKDQLKNAFRQVFLLNEVLESNGWHPIAIGAFFGGVPSSGEDERTLQRNWKRVGSGTSSGWACPYLSCPQPGCRSSQLVWLDTDRACGIEQLRCDRDGCGFIVSGDKFLLTRNTMYKKPPDLLFTGLEILNQHMSSVPSRALLGIGVHHAKRPQVVLLDEAHTYSGTYGAQAALLLRRWKRASSARPHFVGLSATLEDSRRFFANLVGEPDSRVMEIFPRQVDLMHEGQEVLLALRGDPLSKTSLLSTSIQSAMLLRRILDPSGTPGSLFGNKVFVFTDDLDVTNRLFHSLLDAEGWKIDNHRKIRPRSEPPLAFLRSRDADEHKARFLNGQSWDLVEELGHELIERPVVRVGRTSSQDAGVDKNAETIVATASLEVGFDDPDVGAVLQHKAPRDAASFLQRKGRAGRPRGTRPWTVVVLSDFGRDRISYQGYEQLFCPQLRPRYLPVFNRYVLKIQAVFALLDWLAAKLESTVNLWPILAQPPASDNYRQTNEERLDRIVALVEAVISGGHLETELSLYVEQALAVGQEVVEQLLWEPPRSLMLSVLPTIVRRLRSRWVVAVPPGTQARQEPSAFWSPLPEFVPRALFEELNLPEVIIRLPIQGMDNTEHMPILQALREFAPGRVSRRFGVARGDISHWVPIRPEEGENCLIEVFCQPGDFDEIGNFGVEIDGQISSVPCLRPRCLTVSVPPQDIGTTSNARPIWESQFLPRVNPITGELPQGSPWRTMVHSVGFFTHGYGNPVELRRFTRGSLYNIRKRGERISGITRFVRRSGSELVENALGYALDVDAIRVEVVFPVELHHQVQENPDLVRTLRTAYFEHEVQDDTRLDGIANTFEREWLSQICLSALLLAAEEARTSLERAAEIVFDEQAFIALERVLDVIFQIIGDEDQEVAPEDRRSDLAQLIRHPVVQNTLRNAASALWSMPDASWEFWLRRRFLSTTGTAILEACQKACPELDAGDLCLDINPGPRGPEDNCAIQEYEEIWLSETNPGGSGIVEAVSMAYASDPRRFFHLVEAALSPSDFEEIDGELSTIVDWLDSSSSVYRRDLAKAVEDVRKADTHGDTIKASETLRNWLQFAGIIVTHPVLTAMQARILRPGSSPETDGLLARMMKLWREFEERLGVEVDSRIVAYLMSADDSLDRAIGQVERISANGDRSWRYCTLYGLLWPRGTQVRSQMLSTYNQFTDLPKTDRWLVFNALPIQATEVCVESQNWYQSLCITLVNEGAVVLSCPPDSRRELRIAILRILVNPLDTNLLLLQPALAGVTQEGQRLRARFEIREGLQ